MVRIGVKAAAVLLHGSACIQHQRQQLVQPGIHIRLGDLTALYSSQQLPHGVPAGGGHFQRGAVLYAERMVVGAAPVGHNGTGKAPVPAQNILQKMGVLVGIGAVDEVVARHDGLGRSLLDHDLKAGQVQLAQRALVQNGVGRHAAQLLTVDGKMLGAGCNALALDAPHIGGGHLARKIRVLGKILKVASAQGAALGVKPGAEQHGNLLRGGLLAHGAADLLAQCGVPAAGHGGRSREAGRRHAGVQTQMVRRPRLLAHAVRPIRQGDGRHTRLGAAARGEGARARKQRAFLFQIQFCDDFSVFQGGRTPFFIRQYRAISSHGHALALCGIAGVILMRSCFRPWQPSRPCTA